MPRAVALWGLPAIFAHCSVIVSGVPANFSGVPAIFIDCPAISNFFRALGELVVCELLAVDEGVVERLERLQGLQPRLFERLGERG